MNMLNSLIIEGYATNDIEITKPGTGFPVGKFTVAVNRFYKNRNDENVNETSFFDCECYGVLCDSFYKKITKGKGIRVVGRLKQRHFKDENGKDCSKVVIICEHIELRTVSKKEQEQFDKTLEEQQTTF